MDAAVSDGGPCSNERRALTERSAIALRAREANRQALDALRAAQRAYDGAEHAIDAATRAIDGRQILDRKRAAQQRFHQVRSAAASPSDVEAAATAWLAEINELNLSVRDGRSILERERRHAGRLLVELEQASGRVDATRIAAEAAEEDVRRARQALADCQEEHLGHESAVAFAALGGHGAGGMGSGAVPGLAPVAAAAAGERADEEAPPSAAPSVLVRILRGDRALLGRVVAVLAGGSDAEAGRWERELGALVDAIVRAAIDDSAIELPRGHPFWGTFTDEQAHEIARALGSLGYRYDGQGGFQDERWPSMRDLSLAIGYTGLDASFIRIWPTEAEMARLYEGSRVAADRLLEARAPDLTLGQMITLLGRAAEALTPIWDEWGRVRPLLASTAT